ncbi:MAG TPA: glycoside hydrolase family 2 TIM barrel-domain containing protein [Acidimicrobiales bacterium]|nr:glycoside hydrolase family 2 TIM barrel-domain containing protein [Acidimicrobiales bacterium]
MTLQFDDRRAASLDGQWDFFPCDADLAKLADLEPEPIGVPGLWEAQGYLSLDGWAWYRRSFDIDDTTGFWTLHFGAVMDIAEVHLNGRLIATHDSPFTPFEADVTPWLVAGSNELAVRVLDPSLDDPEHLRLAHGKQGWANDIFPSRPSLYLTYGGIWQPVSLRRHGPVAIGSVFVDSDPDDLTVVVELLNRSDDRLDPSVTVRTLGIDVEIASAVDPRGATTVRARLGSTPAPRWSPDAPALHEVLVDVRTQGALSDTRTDRYGLRTVRLEGHRVLVNGSPYRMRSVLVQGFRAAELYGEGSVAQIEEEVAKARAMGFNTLRLHIKAFPPEYLDAADRLGMFLHCDLPVAEPLDHAEMGADTSLSRRCATAIREQVRRDRNHPSIILWSAMNEICLSRPELRQSVGYEQFARALAGEVMANDPTRPVIENEWIEPDPENVFVSPILTAHWYGRLHRDYLAKIDAAATRWESGDRPLFVTEFGDWGLPDMPQIEVPPFWDTRAVHAAGLAGSRWPGTVARFVLETQRYQGLSDRLQSEVFRRHDLIGGYCVTELTDVPHELNGLLDLYRRPKSMAAVEMRRANQAVLPMLVLDSLVVAAGQSVEASVHVANDGPALADVTIETRFGDFVAPGLDETLAFDASHLSPEEVAARFGESTWAARVGALPGYTASQVSTMVLDAPVVPGSHDLVVRLSSSSGITSENRYPIHVVQEPVARGLGVGLARGSSSDTEAALAAVGVVPAADGVLVVGEGGLDAAAGAELAATLGRGGVGLVLAQPASAAGNYPVPVTIEAIGTAWGSSVFQFTTDHGAIPSFPRRAVLVAEDSTIQASAAVSQIDGRPFPNAPVVIAYKPVPDAVTGTVVGATTVGPGRLIFCQYRLEAPAAGGDVAARAVLVDLLRWATDRRPVMAVERTAEPDGRELRLYTWAEDVAR